MKDLECVVGRERGGARLVPGLAVRAGQTIRGKYRVEELLGSGASGIVISARNIVLRERVVLKIFASYTDGQEELLQRRLEKARLAARLRSEHVARIVDIGLTEDGMPYIASEALRGHTLEVELEERGPLPVEEAVRWVLEACAGLAEAHALGLIHGDLKPQNVFLAQPTARRRARRTGAGELDANADPRVMKILDFGTTSPLDGIGDQSASAFFGSPAFLAPEQIQDAAHVDARADVWALGVLLYNLVSGSLPFAADTVSGVIVAVVYDAPSLLAEAPYPLAKIVASCLEKDPAKRPGDVKALAAALAPFAGAGGARLSARVATMLDAAPPPHSDRSARTAATGSIEPPSAPLVEVTRPSRRVIASKRRSRAVRLLVAAASLAVVGWGVMQAGPRSASSSSEPSTTTLTHQEIEVAASDPPVAPEARVPTTTPAALPNAGPAVSFAPTAPGVARPPARAWTPPPPRPPQTARVPLPAGLPTSRESAMPPTPSRTSAPATPPLSSASVDASYVRSLFSERK